MVFTSVILRWSRYKYIPVIQFYSDIKTVAKNLKLFFYNIMYKLNIQKGGKSFTCTIFVFGKTTLIINKEDYLIKVREYIFFKTFIFKADYHRMALFIDIVFYDDKIHNLREMFFF